MTIEYIAGDAEYATEIAPLIREVGPKILAFLHERHGNNGEPDDIMRDINCISASIISSMIGEMVPQMFWRLVVMRLAQSLTERMVPLMENRERVQ